MTSIGDDAYCGTLHYKFLQPPISVAPSDFVPITLDTTNNRVGINKVNPAVALDVSGAIDSTGGITSSTGAITSFGNMTTSTGNFVATSGGLVADTISPSTATFVDILRPFRGSKVPLELASTSIPAENCRGDMLTLRNPTGASTFTLPTIGINTGDYLTFINTSGIAQRITAGTGGMLDLQLAGAGFIIAPYAPPFAITIYCTRGAGGNNTWFSDLP